MASPGKRMRLSANRMSLSGRKSASGANPHTALRTSTSAANVRSAQQQPSYDIITGEQLDPTKQRRLSQSQPQSQPLRRSTSRQSMLPKPEKPAAVVPQSKHHEETLALQSQINKLQYEISEMRNEREMLVLQHEKEIQDEKARADADHRKYQAAESERLKAIRQYDSAIKEVHQARDHGVNDKAALERRLRELESQNASLREEKSDLEGRLNDADREMRRILVEEVEGKRNRLEHNLQETQGELDELKTRFHNINIRLQQKREEAENLESKMLELQSQVGGGEELEVLKRELSEQVAYVRRLETQTRDQATEIRKLRDERRSVNVVMEEKRALEVQLQVLSDIEKRAGELEIQKEILEDEKRMWTSLLEKEGEEGQKEFESPEAVVRTLVNERIEHALTLERLGVVETEVVGKDEALRALESERRVLRMELEKAKEVAGSTDVAPDNKAYKRLERQRQLAAKEVEYLRAQLKTFDAEETTMMSNQNFDTQRAEQVAKLESVVDEYKKEVERLQQELSQTENNVQPVESQPRGSKRSADSRDFDDDAATQMGALQRKNQNLQKALQKTTQQSQLLATELQAAKSQLKALRNSSKTRILELRDNPTANAEAVKMSTLQVLKKENAELLTQLRGEDLRGVKVAPVSSLDALKLDLQDMEKVVAEKDKRMRRQREIWTEKAAEFRDVVASVLGYQVTFMPNGKVKVSSMYYGDKDRAPEELEDSNEYIEFDGDKGTMKIGGGNDGPFGQDLKQPLEFWVKERQEIPCFLAAMTLEFYEKFGSIAPAAVQSR